MPRRRNTHEPKHCLHRPSGRGYVRLNGRVFYTGPYGTDEASDEYARLVRTWKNNNRRIPPASPAAATVNEMLADFWRWASEHYPPRDDGTTGAEAFRGPMRIVRRLFGRTPVADFKVPQLEAVRAAMVDEGWVRVSINRQTNRVRQIFKWGVAREYVDPTTFERLKALSPMKKGQAGVTEAEPVKPVPDAAIAATLGELPAAVRGVVLLQLHTGARPGELLKLGPIDIDTSVTPWECRPASHKLAGRGTDRVILFGPQARQVLAEFMVGRAIDKPLFSPREAAVELKARGAKGSRRPNQKPNQKQTSRRIGDTYTSQSYAQSIRHACRRAGVDAWTPYRLRHNAATALRRHGGIDVAAAVLGHAHGSVVTASTYAEADLDTARKAIEATG
ncbi:MAG: site-specific integrase [Planctomycetota bacterium]